jgi:hypothetical protein
VCFLLQVLLAQLPGDTLQPLVITPCLSWQLVGAGRLHAAALQVPSVQSTPPGSISSSPPECSAPPKVIDCHQVCDTLSSSECGLSAQHPVSLLLHCVAAPLRVTSSCHCSVCPTLWSCWCQGLWRFLPTSGCCMGRGALQMAGERCVVCARSFTVWLIQRALWDESSLKMAEVKC